MKLPPRSETIESLFTGVLITEICFVVFSLIFAVIGGMLANQQYANLPSDAERVTFAVSCSAFVLFLPAGIISWIGLFQRRDWGRWLYAGLATVGHLLGIFIGLFEWSYSWGFPAALSNLACVTNGMIITMIFLTPIADTFTKSSRPPLPPTEPFNEASDPANPAP